MAHESISQDSTVDQNMKDSIEKFHERVPFPSNFFINTCACQLNSSWSTHSASVTFFLSNKTWWTSLVPVKNVWLQQQQALESRRFLNLSKAGCPFKARKPECVVDESPAALFAPKVYINGILPMHETANYCCIDISINGIQSCIPE